MEGTTIETMRFGSGPGLDLLDMGSLLQMLSDARLQGQPQSIFPESKLASLVVSMQ
jgi:hypothetical protein